MKKYLGLAVLAAGLILGAQTASAGSVTYSTTLGPAQLDWVNGFTQQTGSIQQFDPTLFGGDLPSAMTITFVGDLTVLDNSLIGGPGGGVIIDNHSAASGSTTLNGSWTFDVSAAGLVPDFTFTKTLNVGPQFVAPGVPTPSITTFATVGTQIAMTGGPSVYVPVPASFIGSGTVDVTGTDTALIGFTGLTTSSAAVYWNMAAEGTLYVTYEVPAPTPLALLGLGLGMLGLLVARRRSV